MLSFIILHPLITIKMLFQRISCIYLNIKFDHLGITHGSDYTFIKPVYIDTHNSGVIKFGDRLNLNHNVTIDSGGGGKITIGNDVSIGMNTVLRSSNHDYVKNNGHIPGFITIGDNVWIGANCVILPNTKIGSGSVIGAGSIVTKDIPENVVAVGNPCKPIKFVSRG